MHTLVFGVGAWGHFVVAVLVRDMARYPLLAVALGLIYAILFGRLADGLGIPKLFWHQNVWAQMLVGGAVALLASKVLFVTYLLDSLDVHHHTAWVNRLPPGANPLERFLIYGGAALVLIAAALFLMLLLRPTGTSAADKPPSAVASLGPAPRTPLARVRYEIKQIQKVKWVPPWYGAPFWGGVVAGAVFIWFAGHALIWAAWQLEAIAGPATSPFHAPLHALRQIVLPYDPPGDRYLFVAAALFALLLLLDYVLNIFELWPSLPAAGLCNLLGLLAAGYGYLYYLHEKGNWANPLLVIVAAGILVLIAGLNPYKIRLPGFALRADPARGRPTFDYYRRRERVTTCPKQSSRAALDRFEQFNASGGGKRPMAVVCVSGGGIRAGVWATHMLCKLEQAIPAFPSHVPIITGASGGMVGAAQYCATLQPHSPNAAGWLHSCEPGELVDRMARDSLSPVAHRLLFGDLPLMFLPVGNRWDRGRSLERAWNRNMGNVLDVPFAAFRDGEAQGWRPSLVFTPMCVEDGRRMIISNADVDPLALSAGSFVHSPGGIEHGVYSRSGFDFFSLFPKAYETFRVVTAARMNASFPYVAPAASLPTSPRRRVVDAGYYDNYGGDLAGSWVARCLMDDQRCERLRERVSGVVMIEIRDGVSDLKGNPTDFKTPRLSGLSANGNELLAPPQAMLAARDSVSLFRNDTKLDWLMKLFKLRGFPDDFFTAVLLEFEGEASLSWYLSKTEREALEECATSQEVDGKTRSLANWWRDRV